MRPNLKPPVIHNCLRCLHTWVGVIADPQQCPACQSRSWRLPPVEKFQLHCNQCNHDWVGRKAKPRVCPNCRSDSWSLPYQPKRQHTCCFCHHTWKSALEHPKACANCGDRNWDMILGTWECYDCKAGGLVEEWEVTGITTERCYCHICRSVNIGPKK